MPASSCTPELFFHICDPAGQATERRRSPNWSQQTRGVNPASSAGLMAARFSQDDLAL